MLGALVLSLQVLLLQYILIFLTIVRPLSLHTRGATFSKSQNYIINNVFEHVLTALQGL